CELVHVELAEKHGARVAQLTHDFGIFSRYAVGIHGARGRRQNAGRVDVVLEADRNAVQRAAILAADDLGLECARLLERALRRDRYIGVDARVDALDAIEIRAREIDGRQIARRDAATGFRDREARQIVAAR